MAAELIAGGIDAHAIYRHLYEGIPQGKLELLARGLTNVERFDGGLLTRDPPDPRRLPRRPAPTRATPRASSTTCARSRAPRSPGWCATSSRRRAPAAQGLAARDRRPHRRVGDRARAAAAAGTAAPPASRPTSSSPSSSTFLRGAARRAVAPATAALCVARARRRIASRGTDGVCFDKPAGVTSHDVVAEVRRALGARREGRARRARSTRSRPACCSCSSGAATRVQRFLMALPKRYETVARLGYTSTTGDPGGRDHARGGRRRAARRCPRARITPAPAGVLARSRSAASAPTRWRAPGESVEMPEREVDVSRFEQLWREGERADVRDRVLVGHLRALADRRPRRRLLRRAAAHADRRLRRRRRRPGAARRRSTTRSPSCPRVELEPARRRARPRHGVAVPGDADGSVRLRDEDGLIALAEPREDGTLKPVVGFRG